MSWRGWISDILTPVLAIAPHDSHVIRPDIAELYALSSDERLREEDPHTGDWARRFPNWLIATQSRFEVDLNRPREKAVYIHPSDAWGLHVWHETPDQALIDASLAVYDAFYDQLRQFIDDFLSQHPRVVIYDLHSYNHRREGPDGPEADPIANPAVNLGTATMPNRARWAGVINALSTTIEAELGYPVRENVKFGGGNIARWLHGQYPQQVGVLSIEFKKFFMDEWTGAPDAEAIASIDAALRASLPNVVAALE